MANITFYVPDQPPAKYSLDDHEEISIGRAPDCDVILDHSSVSGHHAYIRKIGAGLHVLVDNGSTNGVYLEGEQVSEGPLGNGASFHIGQVPAEYEGDEAAASAAAASQESADPAAMGSSGDSGYGAPIAPVADTSTRPSGFTDMSPIEKFEKKDNMAMIAYIAGFTALLAAVALILMTVMMKVPA